MSQIEVLSERSLPSSHDAEKAILGAVILHNACLGQTAGMIEADDFSLDSHRRIFRRMSELAERGAGIDYTTLYEELKKHDEVESVGGVGYVTDLCGSGFLLPRAQNIEQYVKIVRNKAQLRSIIHNSVSLLERAYDAGEPADKLLSDGQQAFIEIFQKGSSNQISDLSDVARRCIETMLEQQRATSDGCIGLTTGVQELDDLTTGYRPGEYYVIGGRPSSGKSSLILQSIRANCKADIPCGLFSFEMSDESVLQRLAAMEVEDVSMFDLRDMRNLNRYKSDKVAEAWAAIAKWPLFLYCRPASIKEIRAIARSFVGRGVKLLGADYIQHPSIDVPNVKNPVEQVSKISGGLCSLSKELRVPVVALSQFHRPEEKNPLKWREPNMHDLRQSGQIEQDADVIGLVYRPEGEPTQDGKSTWTGQDKIIIGKQRNGPAGDAALVTYNRPKCMFEPRGSYRQASAARA